MKLGPIYSWNFQRDLSTLDQIQLTVPTINFPSVTPYMSRGGLLYLCAAFTWRFIRLDTAFANGTTHIYKPPLVGQNVFEYIMKAEGQWS